MTTNIFQTTQYKQIMQKHIFETIEYLFSQNQEFAIACEVKHLNFNPQLPLDILDNFNETVLFVLAGYTFESASIDSDYFSFEAGFGENNFGSTVTLPLLSIKQLFVGDNPLLFNLATYEKKIEKESSTNLSMEALLNNPENKKLLKNRKS